MLKTYRIIPFIFILFLFGFTLITESPVFAQGQADSPGQISPPQSGTGSGFFVSKMGHVITNAHVVKNCKKITIGENSNKQVSVELINADSSNDLALLKLSTLEMASSESKSLIQKLRIMVVPLASKGLLRSNDVRLGEKVLVAGFPFGDTFSNTINVTTGVVSSTRGARNNSGQFQLDAAVQSGNSGGPIYDSRGNIIGVVVAQINKKTFGSVENMNFGIKASTVRQFLMTSGLSLKMSEQTEDKSTEQLAEIAKNQALMVMCLQRIEQDPLTQGIRIPVIEQDPLTQGIRIPVSGMSDKEKNCRDLWPEYSNIEPDFCLDW